MDTALPGAAGPAVDRPTPRIEAESFFGPMADAHTSISIMPNFAYQKF
jgi:hypothetical protein